MKHPIVLAFALFFTTQTLAQSYMTAGGLRVGTDWGVSLNQRIAEHLTVEGIAQSSLQREEVIVTGLVKRHYPLAFRGFNFYLGGGLHKGWYTQQSVEGFAPSGNTDPFGLTGVAGLELTLAKQLNLSYDFKPAVNITGGERKVYTQTGLTLRYVFIDDKAYNKKLKERKKRKRQEARKAKRQDFFEGEKWKFWKKGG